MRNRILALHSLALIFAACSTVASAAAISRQYTIAPLGDHPLAFEGTTFEYRYGTDEPALYPLAFDGFDASPYYQRGTYIGKTLGDIAYVQSSPQSAIHVDPWLVLGTAPGVTALISSSMRYTNIADINRNGDMVSNNGIDSYFYSRSSEKMVLLPKSYRSALSNMNGLNIHGDVVGSMTSGNLTSAVAYIDKVLFALSGHTEGGNLYDFESALDIADDGRIIVKGRYLDGHDPDTQYFMLTPVPEPSSWLIATILAIVGYRWKRARSQQA